MSKKNEHPDTDAHRAACFSCMMAHDKSLPDTEVSGVALSASDWQEIYYALEDKLRRPVVHGNDSESPSGGNICATSLPKSGRTAKQPLKAKTVTLRSP